MENNNNKKHTNFACSTDTKWLDQPLKSSSNFLSNDVSSYFKLIILSVDQIRLLD